jgi:hypothetical protein
MTGKQHDNNVNFYIREEFASAHPKLWYETCSTILWIATTGGTVAALVTLAYLANN